MDRRTLSLGEIIAILDRGTFDELTGTNESETFDAKGAPYQVGIGDKVSQDLAKHELAKDVSAFANVRGGVILIGVETAKERIVAGEYVARCRLLGRSFVDVEQYSKLLEEWICPPVAGLSIKWYQRSDDPKLGIVAIIIPPESAQGRPYLVRRYVDSGGRIKGTLFGHYERVDERTVPTSIEMLRSRLMAGTDIQPVNDRLTVIESTLVDIVAKLAMLSTNLPATPQPGLNGQTIGVRVANATAVIQREADPNIILTATPSNLVGFPDLFTSRAAEVVKLFENPPVLRQDGFSIRLNKQSEIVDARLRRSAYTGNKLLELWKDGLLIAIGPGDDNLLCWMRESTPNQGLSIHNFVLAEVTLNFVKLAIQIFTCATPSPEALQFSLLLDNMSVNSRPCTLSTGREDSPFPDIAARTASAPSSRIEAFYSAKFEGIDDGSVAYELLGQLYATFGFEYSEMPYIETQSRRITRERLLNRSLS